MSLVSVNYPITGTQGDRMNIFPASKRLPFTATRIDQSISGISSGTDGKVKIQTLANMEGIKIGDYVSWGSDAYTARSSRVFQVLSEKEIEVDEPFTSSVNSNSFVNYKRSWYLEIRYVAKDSVFSDQNAIPISNINSQIVNAVDGSINANIAVPSDALNPSFDLTNERKDNLFTEYKIQYRESWEGNRSGLWVGTSPDEPILLAHGSASVPFNDFTDAAITKRFVKGYPLIYSYVYSNINDGDLNQVRFRYTQYNISKLAIVTQDLYVAAQANGVYLLNVDTNTLQDDCVFVTFEALPSNDSGQYSPDDYDGTQYKTIGEEAGFPFVFPFELS